MGKLVDNDLTVMSLEPLRIGKVVQFEGVGVLARGDVLIVVYDKDATAERSRWLYAVAGQFALACEGNFLVLLVISARSKPPDQATREVDAAGYARFVPKMRRLVVVPEGSGFRASLVRLVIGAYVTLTGKAALVVASNVEDGIARLNESKSMLTPSVAQLAADVSTLRATLETSAGPRVSGRAANK